MNRRAIILTILVVVVALIIVGIGIWLIVKYAKPQNTPTQQTTKTEITETVQKTDSPFPPCFDRSQNAKEVYKTLVGQRVKDKYMRLLNAYSLVLCQQNECLNSLQDKINTLDSWGADANDTESQAIVQAIVKKNDPLLIKFLTQATNICSRQMQAIAQDSEISKIEKENLSGLNSQFYRIHYANFNTC